MDMEGTDRCRTVNISADDTVEHISILDNPTIV